MELTVEALGDEIASLAAQMSAAMCRWLMLVAQFDERRGWALMGCSSCAHWVSWRCGVSPVTAREHVRIAGRLQALPLVREAFARGELSYSKVRALARVDGIQDEAELLELARHASAAQLERIVGAFRGVTREEADAAYAGRSLDAFYDADGSLVLRGRLPAELGAAVLAAIHHAESELERRVGDASADADGVDPARPTPAARRADALVWLAQTAVSAPEEAGRVTSGRCEVVVQVDAATLTGADAAEARDGLGTGNAAPAVAGLEAGPPLAAETVRRLCCDAGIVPVTVDAEGDVLDVGRRTRSIPPAIRRALRVRDAGCRFPGCGRTRWLQAHHVEHWAHGGATKLSNLVLLCHHHHQLVHEGGFVLQPAADAGAFDAEGPGGQRIPHVPPAPVEALVSSGFPVPATPAGAPTMPCSPSPGALPDADRVPGPLSLFPLSSGAPWDLGYAVDALLEWTTPTILARCP